MFSFVRKMCAAWRAAFVAGIGFALASCAVVSSETIDSLSKSGAQFVGVSYALPMGLIDVTLFLKESTGEHRLAVKELYVADPSKRYVMRYQPLPNYKDDIEIKVRSNFLLEKVWATTEDETDAIIVALAKFARDLGAFQSAAAPSGFSKLANVTIDPTESEQVRKAAILLSAKVRAFAQTKYAIACAGENAKTPLCKRYARYRQSNVELVELAVEYPNTVAVAATAADCSVGLCYRVKEPYIIKYAVDGVKGATIVHLPNKSPIVELDISRAFFVGKIQKIDFDNDGFLKSATVDKKSEIQAVAAVPITVVTAISQALPLRLTIQQRQLDLAEKRLAELDAREALMQARPGPD